MNKIVASVVIPTLNRQPVVAATIEAFKDQSFKDFELVIVDQTDGVLEPLISLRDKELPFTLRYFNVNFKGLTKARNFGIDHSNGEIIIFVDDDIVPSSFLVEKHLRNYDNPDIVGVAGRVVDSSFPVENDSAKILKITKYGSYRAGKNGTVRTEIDFLGGTNMSFRAAFVKQNGIRFDEKMKGSETEEEVEFSLCLKESSGKQLYFDPLAKIVHLAVKEGGCGNRSMDPALRTIKRQYNIARLAFNHPEKIDVSLFLLARFVSLVKHSVSDRNITIFTEGSKEIYEAFKDSKKK